MKWKIAAAVSSAAFFVLCTLVVSLLLLRHSFRVREFDTPGIVKEVQALNQLVTVRCRIQRVVGLREPKFPVGEESVLLMVQGEALAGVDLSKLKPSDVAVVGKRSILISLPPARLLDVFVDEKQTKVWDHEITWWTPWVPIDPDLEHKARLEALDDIRKDALQMGIVNQAQTNAEAAIRDLLSAAHIDATFKKNPLD